MSANQLPMSGADESARKTIVITGASDGIGAAAAEQLQAAGHEVVIVGRSSGKTQAVADALHVRSYTADFSELSSVRSLAARLRDDYPRIDVLANNAGGVFGDRKKTIDGFERTIQVNHLAPFLLTHLLMPTLLESRAVVIQTSSIAARLYGNLDLGDVNNERHFSANKAYGDSKLANILFTKELHRLYRAKGLRAAAFHPGLIRSSFASGTTSLSMRMLYSNPLTKGLLKTAVEGADQLRWLSEAPEGAAWLSGEYYEKRAVPKRVNPQIRDAQLARSLWAKSEQLLGL